MLKGKRQQPCSARNTSPLCQEWEPRGAQATWISSVQVWAPSLNATTCLTTFTNLAWCSSAKPLCRSHNFLNQKPWHPLNFRNQMKVFEAQEQAEKDAKAKAVGKVRPGQTHAAKGL